MGGGWGGARAAPSLPMGVDEGDVVCMRIRGGPSPPRVLCECEGVGVKELLMGSGFGHVYPASHPPTHAHCIVEVAGLWDTTIG